MNEQRKHPRIEIHLPASFEIVGTEENLALATTLNVSTQGMCLSSKERLTIGQILKIKVSLEKETSIFLDVEVIWIRSQEVLVTEEYLFGVQLINTSSEQAYQFRRFCERRLGHAVRL